MTDLAQIQSDIDSLKKWLIPGAIDPNQLSLDQLQSLIASLGNLTTKLIGLRVGLQTIADRRQQAN